MKNPALEDIKTYAAQRLQREYGFCGVADGPTMALLTSSSESDAVDIRIEIKCESPEESAAAAATSAAFGLPVLAYDAGDGVRIEAAKVLDGATLWAVRLGGTCLGSDGEWDHEPQPGNRDAEFLSRCRYATPQAALDVLNAMRRHLD